MFGFLSGRKKRAKVATVEDDEADRVEAAELEARRSAAARRVLDNLRDARTEREAQQAAEDEACETIALSRAITDTERRKVAKNATEISGETAIANGDNGAVPREPERDHHSA